VDGYVVLCFVSEMILTLQLRYMDDILKTTDEDVEEVFVEADGEWHSPDDKYYSSGWSPPPKSSTLTNRDTSASSTAKTLTPSHDKPKVEEDVKANGSHVLVKPTEEIILDSDEDDDDVRVRREIIPISSSSPGSGVAHRAHTGGSSDVIDLTLDSDDDDPTPPTTVQQSLKRKERSTSSDSGEGLAAAYNKRTRLEPPLPPPQQSGGSGGSLSSYNGSNSHYGDSGDAGSNSSSLPLPRLPPTSSFGVRSIMSNNHLPALHLPTPGGSFAGRGPIQPPSATGSSGFTLSPLVSPRYPPGDSPPMQPMMRSSVSTPTLSNGLGLPSRPSWAASPPLPPSPRDPRDYRRDSYGNARQW